MPDKKKETHVEVTDSTGSYRIVDENGNPTKGEGKPDKEETGTSDEKETSAPPKE